MRIAISRIDIPYVFRKYSFDISDIKASMDAEGQKVPINVRQRGDRYILVDGWRRLQAAKELGWDEIDAVVNSFTSMDDVIKDAITINRIRTPFSTMDYAYLFKDWIDNGVYSRNQIKELMGFGSPDTVTNYIALTEQPEQIQNFVHEGSIGMETALTLRRIEDVDRRIQFAADLVAGRISRQLLFDYIRRREPTTPPEITYEEERRELEEIPPIEEARREVQEEERPVVREPQPIAEVRVQCPVKEMLCFARVRAIDWMGKRDLTECEACEVKFMCPLQMGRFET